MPRKKKTSPAATQINLLVDIEPEIVDDELDERESVHVRYEISSYGSDMDVETLVGRLKRNEIVIPPFQRSYVWTPLQASRFIESLLMGLPVPGLFFYRDNQKKNYVVIDGQQRLRTLQYFLGGAYDYIDSITGRQVFEPFRLTGVQERYNGRCFDQLDPDDQRQIRFTIIHATIVNQDAPQDDVSGIYHIYERINSGGMRLFPHEIRSCILSGPFSEVLAELNGNAAWRSIYGPPSKRMKDRELILRFLSMLYWRHKYQPPMKEHLNNFMRWNRDLDQVPRAELVERFTRAIEQSLFVFGPSAFRGDGPLNAAIFESMMIGIATRLDTVDRLDRGRAIAAVDSLLSNSAFTDACSRATANENAVATRISLAIEAFAKA